MQYLNSVEYIILTDLIYKRHFVNDDLFSVSTLKGKDINEINYPIVTNNQIFEDLPNTNAVQEAIAHLRTTTLNFKYMSSKTFRSHLNYKNNNFVDLNFDNILIAGGFISTLVFNQEYTLNENKLEYSKLKYSKDMYNWSGKINVQDIDIFIYGLNEDKANEKVDYLISKITKGISHTINRSNNTVDIIIFHEFNIESNTVNQVITRTEKYQIILRLYNTKSEILHGFDIGSSSIGYDGQDILLTSLSKFSFEYGVNIVDTYRRSPQYIQRLVKYFNRGFSIVLPFLNLKGENKDDFLNFIDMNEIKIHDKYIFASSKRWRDMKYNFSTSKGINRLYFRSTKDQNNYFNNQSKHKVLRKTFLSILSNDLGTIENVYVFNLEKWNQVDINENYDKYIKGIIGFSYVHLEYYFNDDKDYLYYNKYINLHKLYQHPLEVRIEIVKYIIENRNNQGLKTNVLLNNNEIHKKYITTDGYVSLSKLFKLVKTPEIALQILIIIAKNDSSSKITIKNISNYLKSLISTNLTLKKQEILSKFDWIKTNPASQFTSSVQLITESPRNFYKDLYNKDTSLKLKLHGKLARVSLQNIDLSLIKELIESIKNYHISKLYYKSITKILKSHTFNYNKELCITLITIIIKGGLKSISLIECLNTFEHEDFFKKIKHLSL